MKNELRQFSVQKLANAERGNEGQVQRNEESSEEERVEGKISVFSPFTESMAGLWDWQRLAGIRAQRHLKAQPEV